MIADNQEHDREVYAYVYSEVGEIDEFLDDESGKYGRAAVAEALADGQSVAHDGTWNGPKAAASSELSKQGQRQAQEQ